MSQKQEQVACELWCHLCSLSGQLSYNINVLLDSMVFQIYALIRVITTVYSATRAFTINKPGLGATGSLVLKQSRTTICLLILAISPQDPGSYGLHKHFQVNTV